jgi:hypothetical protein
MQLARTVKCPVCGVNFVRSGDKLNWSTNVSENADPRTCKAAEGVMFCEHRTKLAEEERPVR